MSQLKLLEIPGLAAALASVPMKQIHANDYNPNEVPQQIFEAIRDDIVKNGFVKPIHLNACNCDRIKGNHWVIIDGEHRWQIMREKGARQIASFIHTYSEVDARIATVRWNREHGELNQHKFADLVRALTKHQSLNDLALEMAIPKPALQDILEEKVRWEAHVGELSRPPRINEPRKLFMVDLTFQDWEEANRIIGAQKGKGYAEKFMSAVRSAAS